MSLPTAGMPTAVEPGSTVEPPTLPPVRQKKTVPIVLAGVAVVAVAMVGLMVLAKPAGKDDKAPGASAKPEVDSAKEEEPAHQGTAEPGQEPPGIASLFPDDDHDERVEAWRSQLQEIQSLLKGSSREAVKDQTYDSSVSLQKILDAAAEARRAAISPTLKELAKRLDEIKDQFAERQKKWLSVKRKTGRKPEMSVALEIENESSLIEERDKTIKKLELEYAQCTQATSNLSFVDGEAREELAALKEMEQLKDNWSNDSPVSPTLLNKARNFAQGGNLGLRFLALATLARSKSLPDLELVAKQAEAKDLSENQAARLCWWLAHSGESRMASQGVERFRQAPALLDEVDGPSLVDAVLKSPDQWRPLLPQMLKQAKAPDTSLKLLKVACQYKDPDCVSPILESRERGGLKGSEAEIVVGVLEAKWIAAYEPVVNVILKADPQLKLTGLDRLGVLNPLVREAANEKTIAALTAHLLANGDANQMEWAVDVYNFRDGVLSSDEFRNRASCSQKTMRSILLNHLLRVGTDKTLAEAEWLLRRHASEIPPDSINKELLDPQVLARKTLEIALVDMLWQGNGASKDWALTQELGGQARTQLVGLRDQVARIEGGLNVLANWLGRAPLINKLRVFNFGTPDLGLDFDQELDRFRTNRSNLEGALQAGRKTAGGPRAGASSDRDAAHQAVENYITLTEDLRKTSSDIWKIAQSPLKTRTKNIPETKYQELNGQFARCKTVLTDLKRTEQEIPWLAR